MTWRRAADLLGPHTVIVLPIGAAAKEHGLHLTLENDWLLAEHLAERVAAATDDRVVVAPTLGYHHYPAFVEYAGSTTLRAETARDLVIDVCTSLAAFGPRRFYALNTGVSTVRPLAMSAEALAKDGVSLTWLDPLARLAPLEKELCAQPRGTHADEVETSMMLVVAPDTVDLSKAVPDCDPGGKGGLSPVRGTTKTWSPTGGWGDPTLATREKGVRFLDALVAGALEDLELLLRA